MASKLKKDTKTSVNDTTTPYNYTNPIRLAFLGGAKSGKSSTVSKLTLGNFRDTYYPTHQLNPILLNYRPSESALRILTGPLVEQDSVIPTYLLKASGPPASNPYYKISGSTKKEVTRILVELIDTPSFNPQSVVPFLEASLHSNLGKDILRNLANEPRKPVSTNPILVASGASEMNGNVDGYFFVYSAIPSYAPPGYEDSGEVLSADHSLNLLPVMKATLDEAWSEYDEFVKKKDEEKEQDIFSMKVALKNLWKEPGSSSGSKSKKEVPESAKFYLPPIWIVCTHKNSSLASPKLIAEGKRLAREWKCGFLAIDNLEEGVDDLLALMIRDIIQPSK
ncbi:hypothetical protein Cantr_09217 [Candida viswanathii]|uniref:Uncharacterized protein n=1 Tax=Candida viswanathii TaxID=5486 RepID=A0A367Y938_9ASCO|nr:hypothetical protein Cantr_09217 [Candida viswanathii]